MEPAPAPSGPGPEEGPDQGGSQEDQEDFEQLRNVAFLFEVATEWGLGEDEAKAAVICQLALTLSPDPYKVQAHTGYDIDFVKHIYARMIWNGILCHCPDDKGGAWALRVTWPEDDTGHAVMLDCMVAAGVLLRGKDLEYCLADEDRYYQTPSWVADLYKRVGGSHWSLVRVLRDKAPSLSEEEAVRAVFYGFVRRKAPGTRDQQHWWITKSKRMPAYPDELIEYLIGLHHSWTTYKSMLNCSPTEA